jgi:hypothetical protein
MTFFAANEDDMYLRVVDNLDAEITFSGFQKFLTRPVTTQPFTVSKEPTDGSIRVLRWGNNLQHRRNVNRNGGTLPAGWVYHRFFRIGAQSVNLEVTP